MVARKKGYIINIASVAGMIPGAAGATLYGASKAFMVQFSRSLHLEQEANGVHVTALCPGFTWSEFHDVQGTRELTDKLPGFLWQDAQTVARAGLDAVMAGQPVCVPGAVNKTLAYTSRLFPERIRYLMGKAGRMVE